MATSAAEDYISINTVAFQVTQIPLVPDEASLFGMLKIVPVAFVDLAIHSLLYPNDFIDKPKKSMKNVKDLLVSMLFEELGREPILVVDDPNKQKPITLKSIIRNVV